MKINKYTLVKILISIIIGAGFNLPAHTKSMSNRNRNITYAFQKLRYLQLRNPATRKMPVNIREKELEFTKTLPSR